MTEDEHSKDGLAPGNTGRVLKILSQESVLELEVPLNFQFFYNQSCKRF